MRVALGQLNIAWKDKERTICSAKKMIIEASKAKCDIIIFPELSFTGFTTDITVMSECVKDSQTVAKMKELAVKYKIAIGFGWSGYDQLTDKKATNRFSIIDMTGDLVMEYSKLHPFTYGGEDRCFEKGNEIISVPFLGHTISLFICYDLRFPEIFQIAARKSDVMFVIANWPSIRSTHWTTLLRARAIETQSYVVGVNNVGEYDGTYYSGDSMAVDSIGNILGRISNKEGVLICDLDDRAWSLRNKFSTATDRREDFYIKCFDKER